MTRLVTFLIGKSNWLLAASVLVILLLALGIPRAGFDSSLSVLMTRSDPYLQERDRLQEEFPAQQEISFAFVPHSGDVFTLEALRAIVDLNREFRQIPLAITMSSILGWQSPYGEDTLFERPLTQLDSYTAGELVELREQGLSDPFVAGALLSPQADLALASVRLTEATLTSEQSRESAQAVQALLESLRARHSGVEIHASSEALYEQSNRSAMISDLTLLLPLVLLVCTVIICYSFRSLLLGLCILIVALTTVVMTLGTLGWAAHSLNTISVMAPLVVVTIAVADSVHIISIFRQNLLNGATRAAAMTQSLLFNFRPITLASITTGIGFASLNLASSPAISEFGSVVAIGVCFAYVLTLTILPALVLMLPLRIATASAGVEPTPLTRHVTDRCLRLVATRGNTVLWVVGVLSCIALALSFLNRTDFDRMSFINDDSPLREFYDAVSSRMDVGPQLLYGVDSQQEYGVIEPEFMQRLDTFSAWLREQDEVVSVASLVEVVKAVNQASNDNREDAYVIPADAVSIENNLFSYQQVQVNEFSLTTLANENFSLLRLFVSTRDMTNRQLLDFNARVNTRFAEQFPSAGLLHGSSVLLFARMDSAVTIELLQGFAMSLALITLTLVIGMRSLYYGVLSMLPNLLPALLVFGVWGLFVGEINPFVMMLFSISVGLVVDDTVHVLSIYQSCRVQGATPPDAVASALTKSGPALIITTVILALGTCVLIAASTVFFQQAATLLVPIVILALVLDLIYFPALLLRFDRLV